MSDLRLPVEAERKSWAWGGTCWSVRDADGSKALCDELIDAFRLLAELQKQPRRTMPLPDWPARIETEQIRQAAIARFEDAATREMEQPYTAEQRAEWDRWNDEGMREIAEANYKGSPR